MNASTRRHRSRATAENRRFLDALVFWRALYARRGPQDRGPEVGDQGVITTFTQPSSLALNIS
jgi:hypothetical protein